MTRFDFYKELYYKELERKKALNDSLTLPIGVITGVIAWLFYFYNNYYNKSDLAIPTWVFIIYLLSLTALILSVLFLILSYFEPKFKRKKYFITSAYDYYYIDFADKYENFYKENNSKQNKTEDLEELLIEHFISCSQYNTSLNDRKTARLLRTKLFLVSSLAFSFVLLIFPVTNKSSFVQKQKLQEVKIVDTIKINYMNSVNENKPANLGGKPKPRPIPEKPVKDDRPKVRILPETKVPPPGKPLHS